MRSRWSGEVRWARGHNTDLLPRSVPGLVLEQVSLQEKHWQALASGLADCGARLQQVRLVQGSHTQTQTPQLELSNFSTEDESMAHIIKCCLCVARVQLTRRGRHTILLVVTS